MKSITNLCIPLLAMLAILFSCADDESTQNSQVQFGVNLIGNDRQALTNLPDGSYFMISIINSVGEPVISDEKIDVIAGKQFLTLPMDLPPGNYKLTDLSLVDENSGLIRYTVPQATASLGTQVNHALNFEFSIGNGEMSTFDFDLLSVSKYKPEEFGLATFKISRNKLKIMVHADGMTKPVTAEAFILQGIDTVDHYELEAKMNQVALHGDPTQPYVLWITKTDYSTYTKQFAVSELQNGRPWVVMLEHKQSFRMLTYAGEFTFGLVLTGTINLDWGDNNDTTVTVDSSTPSQLWMAHFYSALGNYSITITGDVDQITEFYSYYGQAPIDSVDFAPLVNLSRIRFGLTRSPKIIDLTHNNKLEFANLVGLTAEQILLPPEHNINFIMIAGPNGMTPEAVDAVINNIYANSISKGITNGHFTLNALWYEEGDMVGPPSAAAVEKLRILQNDYGWSIGPEVPPGE